MHRKAKNFLDLCGTLISLIPRLHRHFEGMSLPECVNDLNTLDYEDARLQEG
jgi:hypothetical protein